MQRAGSWSNFPGAAYLLHLFKKESAPGASYFLVPVLETIRARLQTARARSPEHIRRARREMSDDEQTVTTVHDGPFEPLEIRNAAYELARTDLAAAISLEIRRRGMTQTQAAKLLGIKQPDVSAIMNARVGGFSQERLERLLNALGMEVRIQVGPRPAGKECAGISVQIVESF